MTSLPDLQPWQKAFRDGISPELATAELVALQMALAGDDPALLQGATTEPPPLQTYSCHPCEAACPLAYAGWRGQGLPDLYSVEQRFAELCHAADQRLGWEGSVSTFMNYVDETPRDVMLRELLAEVNAALNARLGAAAAAA